MLRQEDDPLHNSFHQALTKGQKLLGGWNMSGSPMLVEAMGFCGFDFIVLDLEHSPTSAQGVLPLLQAADSARIPAVVRMASHDPIAIKHVLDLGATSLYFPFVQNAAQAAQIVAACHYPPKGKRGFAKLHRASRYLSVENYYARAADSLFLVAQIETLEAFGQLEDIANTDGIGGIFIGPSDLSVSMGLPGAVTHRQVRAIMEEAARVCADMDIPIGTVMPTPEDVRWAYEVGYSFVSLGNDMSLLVGAARAGIAKIRDALD